MINRQAYRGYTIDAVKEVSGCWACQTSGHGTVQHRILDAEDLRYQSIESALTGARARIDLLLSD
jgi:hypothetical protein